MLQVDSSNSKVGRLWNPDVIIIGGGVAGLSAALHLAERGLKPLILEADEKYIGGRLRGGETLQIGEYNFRLEHGAHGIWSQYRNLQAMLARHNLRPVLVPAQEEAWIYRARKHIWLIPVGSAMRRTLIPPPFHYLQLFFRPKFLAALGLRELPALFHVWAGLIMALGIDPLAENQPMAGLTLGDLTRKWSPALKAFFLGLARNGLSSHPDEVSISGFISFLRFYTLLRRDAWMFSYLPDDGGTSICEPLAARVQQLGGEILLGSRVLRLVQKNGDWQVTRENSSGEENLRAKHLILATDSNNAQKILRASFGGEVEHLLFPQALSNAIVRLWFNAKPNKMPEAGIFTGDSILHNFFWLDRIYNDYRRWSRQTGGSALEAHIYGPPETLALPDAALLAKAISEAQQTFPELRGHLIKQHLQRNAEVHTLPQVFPKEKHLGVETQWENLFCAGDWVRHEMPSFFLERACATGMEAANRVLEKRGMETWQLIPYLPAEPLTAWIQKVMVRGRKTRRSK